MTALLFLIAVTAIAAPAVQQANLRLSFEPNSGQAPPEARFLARGAGYILYLNGGETILAGRNQTPLRTRLSGANPEARITGEGPQDSKSNYFIGNHPDGWHTSVPNFSRVHYAGVYPGIDLMYYGKDGDLEYDWIVSPGADPRKIRMVFESTNQLQIDARGDLVIRSGANEYRHKKPAIYQQAGGRRIPVAGGWTLHGNEASFRLGAYDPGKELVIDPPLIYATYYGGNGLDYGYGVAVDSLGNTYVAGGVGSPNFNIQGTEDAFVTKYRADGSKMFTVFLGGAGMDEAEGIAVDVQGNMYVTGNTGSRDFPVKNPVQAAAAGSGDAFLVKLNASGAAITYSTYLGGFGTDTAAAIAVDSVGNAYVVGSTFSTDFPTVNPFQRARGAQQDAFVAKMNPAGSAWVYCTYLGGNGVDQGNAIAVDAAGNAYVTGYTGSTDFPLQSAFRGSNAASVDAFVTKLNPVGSALVYSTYLGGSATDYGTAIAVDASGSAYVTGVVTSDDFPLANPIDNKLGSHAVDDVFVTKFNPSGSGLVFSTYLGGASEDDPYALALDQAGNVYITGRTNSSDFPLKNPLQVTRTAFDMFVTEIDASGAGLLFSTFLGGSGSESGRGIAVDGVGNIHIAGEGTSTDFPVKNASQGSNGGGAAPQDALVLLLGNAAPPSGPVITVAGDNVVAGATLTPGGWFYVKGTNLADTMRIWGASDFADPNTLPVDLNGTEVWVNGVPVPVYFISPGQVNAQVPSSASGTVTIQVVRLGVASNTLTAPVAQIQPSIYFYAAGSKDYAAAVFLDYTLMGDPAVVAGTRKAKPGDILVLYTAGLAPNPSGTAITSPIEITGVGLTIGTTDVPVMYAGLVAPGQFQVNFTVPSIPPGEYSMAVSASGRTSLTSQPNVLIEIGQ